jgi:hypothetical protein
MAKWSSVNWKWYDAAERTAEVCAKCGRTLAAGEPVWFVWGGINTFHWRMSPALCRECGGNFRTDDIRHASMFGLAKAVGERLTAAHHGWRAAFFAAAVARAASPHARPKPIASGSASVKYAQCAGKVSTLASRMR